LATWNNFISYNNQLAFTPYFSCSPWITRDALLTWGRNDTPYLKPVLDRSNSACEDFYGHGVGLSGKWAQYMAQRGIPYRDILEYYYPWTTVK
jgi:peptidoglycan hydrolase-like amidase